MMIYRFFHLISFLFLISCSPSKEPLSHIHGIAMTIPYHIAFNQTDSNSLQQAQNLIREIFVEVDQTYNVWNPTSEISRLNAWTEKEPFQCTKNFWNFLKGIGQFVEISDKMFDPTIEPLQAVWRSSLENGTLPSRDEVSSLLSCVGWDKLIFLEGERILKTHGGTKVDVGGIAKGHAVDLLTEGLQQLGFSSLYVEWGGEVRVQGSHPSKRPWKIGIESPYENASLQTLEIKEGAVATSGDYMQYWKIPSQNFRFFHIMDPFTGHFLQSTPTSIASVTVYHPSCRVADALSTILLLMEHKKDAMELFDKKISKQYPEARCWILSHDS
jgi:FAD:protein FMN transferase